MHGRQARTAEARLRRVIFRLGASTSRLERFASRGRISASTQVELMALFEPLIADM